MKATQGRIVIYKGLWDGKKYAAIINQVYETDNDAVELTVFFPTCPQIINPVTKGDNEGQWDWMDYQKGQAAKTEELEAKLTYETSPETIERRLNEITIKYNPKDLGITEVKKAKENISDLVVYGDGDTFALLCKASSQEQGWMKSTKVCNVVGGCIMQATTQQRNPDGTYAVAEALTYVPNMNIDVKANPRVLKYVNSMGGL